MAEPTERPGAAGVAVPKRQEGRGRGAKFEQRRSELADAALKTLSELGYARTSLREIAQNSEFSHGVLHYYFADKVDLITQCVRQYKTRCMRRYDSIIATASTAAQLRHEFSLAMAESMVQDADLHRLWYDLRSQSMFDPAFRADVAAIDAGLCDMTWRVARRIGELADVSPPFGPEVTYGIMDGLFQQALLRHCAGDATAADYLVGAMDEVMARFMPLAPV
ncbi:TetR/AcrR family transcriptional regulator [Kineosporia rhizophila]|uniref:TetR/AcrR family transcriptional regulator n=1 Tax=Kineosporia rhizophila TaxID=84633 RepID=UPI001E4A6D5C|nr:TetR/AcrR family transcriptional regulator [Kineosporia sp. NBRC 101677]MCE0535971.1 TetR/AcrR family transcriptional regulator [Kineosporia rhizophila]